DASRTGACPTGMTQGYRNVGDVLPGQPEMQRRPEETDAEYSRRAGGALFASTQNLCMHPERGAPDLNFRTVTGSNVRVGGGIDLDNQVSRVSGKPAPGTCAHDDFPGMSGERGIDNQFFRVVGCSTAFQPGGQSNDLVTEMLTGSWGILLTVSGVNDMHDAPNVELGLYANA